MGGFAALKGKRSTLPPGFYTRVRFGSFEPREEHQNPGRCTLLHSSLPSGQNRREDVLFVPIGRIHRDSSSADRSSTLRSNLRINRRNGQQESPEGGDTLERAVAPLVSGLSPLWGGEIVGSLTVASVDGSGRHPPLAKEAERERAVELVIQVCFPSRSPALETLARPPTPILHLSEMMNPFSIPTDSTTPRFDLRSQESPSPSESAPAMMLLDMKMSFQGNSYPTPTPIPPQVASSGG